VILLVLAGKQCCHIAVFIQSAVVPELHFRDPL